MKKHPAKCSFPGPVLGLPVPLYLPTVSFGSSRGNDNFPALCLSSLPCVKLQNDISFLLISPKGKQHIIQEFCVKSWHLMRPIGKPSAFSICAAERTDRSYCSWFPSWNASPVALHLCPWQLPQVHVASQTLYVLFKSFGVQNKSPWCHPFCRKPRWHGGVDRQIYSNQACGLGKPYYWHCFHLGSLCPKAPQRDAVLRHGGNMPTDCFSTNTLQFQLMKESRIGPKVSTAQFSFRNQRF